MFPECLEEEVRLAICSNKLHTSKSVGAEPPEHRSIWQSGERKKWELSFNEVKVFKGNNTSFKVTGSSTHRSI